MRRTWPFLILIFLLAACRQDETEPTATTDAAATNTTVSTATATRPQATPTHAATPTPSPEPQPGLTIADQTLDDSGLILVERVISLTPGVIALYADESGELGDFITYVAVPSGTTADVSLSLSPFQATEILHARLFSDEDENNVPDDIQAPLVEVTFRVDVTAALPSLTIADQTINTAGQLRIDAAAVPGPSWIVIHNDLDGELGDIVGFFPVSTETTYPLTMTIQWRDALPQLQAVLYQDAGERGRFEPNTDTPLIIQGQTIAIPFHANLPLDMFVLDQPVVDGTITVERVVSNGPGWLVVYNDDNGQPGLIIGFVPLEPGLNTAINIPLQENSLTFTLYLWLHEDSGTPGEFDYPVADDVIRVEGRLPTPFAVRTNTNNYLIARDQPFDNGEVIVTNVVLNEPGWVVIHNNAAGELGEVIGQVWVPRGVSRELVVPIDLDGLTTTLHVVLYTDQGEAQVFDGEDTPFRISGRVIRVPIFLTD